VSLALWVLLPVKQAALLVASASYSACVLCYGLFALMPSASVVLMLFVSMLVALLMLVSLMLVVLILVVLMLVALMVCPVSLVQFLSNPLFLMLLALRLFAWVQDLWRLFALLLPASGYHTKRMNDHIMSPSIWKAGSGNSPSPVLSSLSVCVCVCKCV
jgi:hypothetical protein